MLNPPTSLNKIATNELQVQYIPINPLKALEAHVHQVGVSQKSALESWRRNLNQ